jgi:hypothetical protein
MANTIQIKRRLPDSILGAGAPATLAGGELAFNEVDTTLYYGSSAGVIPIAGSGAFVDRTSDQTIGGNKTFTNLTTLSSTTFSSGSIISAGENVIGDLATPSLSGDAANKKYVDDLEDRIAENFVDRSTNQTVSGEKTFEDNTYVDADLDVSGNVDANTYSINGTQVIDSSYNAYVNSLTATGNVVINGDLTVFGENTIIETTVTTTSSFSITNNGSGPALSVTQTGATDVAAFYDGDEANVALVIKDGGNVGINTATPNERLTVVGNISASGTIYADGGLSVDGGGTDTTLWVENGVVGINTETPNEELTVVGSISASEDIYARNGIFSGTFRVDQGVTFASTVSAIGAVTFDSTLYVGQDATFMGTISGQNGVSYITDFIIQGGTF